MSFGRRDGRIEVGRAALAVLLLALVACRASQPKPPPELRVPAIEISVAHYAGSPLSGVGAGGSAARLDGEPAHALAVRSTIDYVERESELDLPLVTTRARLVAGVRDDQPIRSTSELATRARIATGAQAEQLLASLTAGSFGRAREVAALEGALPSAATIVFAAVSRDYIETAENGRVQRRVQIELARGAGQAENDVSIAMVVEDFAPARAADDEEAPAAPSQVLRREELVLADRPQIGGAPLVFVFPSPFRDGDGKAFVMRVNVAAAPSEPQALARHAELLAQCLRDAAEAEAQADQRARPVAAQESRQRELAGAIEGLKTRASRRAALVFLAAWTDAELCGDFALASDDATLDAFVDGLGPALKQGELAFALERATLAFLAARKANAPLAPELDGLLARYAGEIGRSASGIEDVLATASDLAGLHQHIVEENRIYLDDSSVAARTRAFDWLSARGLAPAGFDPLGAVEERRAALEAAEEAAGGGR